MKKKDRINQVPEKVRDYLNEIFACKELLYGTVDSCSNKIAFYDLFVPKYS